MCDSLTEVNLSPVIHTEDLESVKEKLSRELTEDVSSEINKDLAPEVLDKVDCNNTVSKELLNLLVSGILSLHVEDLKKVSSNLNELTRNQHIVIETLQQENTRFVDAMKVYNLDDVFSRAKLYSTKLQVIKKEMSAAHERLTKLKKRALRLQQQKQKEALHKEQQRDQELERDKQLAPKLATKC